MTNQLFSTVRFVSGYALLLLTLPQQAAASERLQLVSPGGQADLLPVSWSCPTFSWGRDPKLEVASYELAVLSLEGDQIDSLEIGDPVLIERLPGSATSWTPPSTACLEPGGGYAWSLRVIDESDPEASESGDWATPLFFRVPALPEGGQIRQAVEILRAAGLLEESPLAAAPAAPPDRADAAKAARTDRGRSGAALNVTSALATAQRTGMKASLAYPGEPDRGFGLHGVTATTGPGSAGVVGEATAAVGSVHGVIGVTHSADGAAGVFEDRGGGDVLRGLVGGAQVFAVDGGGLWTTRATTSSVVTASLLDQDLSNFFDLDPACTADSHIVGLDGDGRIHCAPDSGDISAVTAGSGLNGGGSSGAVTLSHQDTSSAVGGRFAEGLVFDQVTLDGFGHVTQLDTKNLDDRYFTERESLSNFVESAGDAMTGPLAITGGADVTPSAGGHLVLGTTTGPSIAIDSNEIMARDNRTASDLFLQREGGAVSIGTGDTSRALNVAGDIGLTGELHRSATGTANMVPLAYGRVRYAGDVVSGSGNFSVARLVEGQYEIRVDGVICGPQHIIIAVDNWLLAPRTASASGCAAPNSSRPGFGVWIWGLDPLRLVDANFSFVIYEP